MYTENNDRTQALAKLTWTDPRSGETREYVLMEGATASIGRLDDNDIVVKEQHVSRQHAVIAYRDGVFTITDLGSANGTFVNDQKLEGIFPLASGDVIRLYVPTLRFSATVSEEEHQTAIEQGTLITATNRTGHGRVVITSGPHEGESIPLLLKKVTVGRAVPNAGWEICLQDPAISRPHARFELTDSGTWVIYDLGSANGTQVNGTLVNEKGRALRDGDVITMGATVALFRE